MLENAHDPRSVTLSVRLYRRLVLAYPRSFRQEYSIHMAQVFRDCCRKAYIEGGTLSLLSLWARTGLDYLKTMIEQYARGGTYMTREKFIKLSGWGIVLAAVCLLLTFLPEADKILVGFYRTFGTPASAEQHAFYQRLSVGARSLLFPVAIFLITTGLIGLYVRFGIQASKTAKTALWIGVSGGAVALVISASTLMGADTDRPLMNIFMAVMFAGLVVFGIAALRNRAMPRGNGLPVLAGIWWPLLVIQAYSFPQVMGQAGHVPAWFSVALFSIMGLFLALLGYVLQADALLAGTRAPFRG